MTSPDDGIHKWLVCDLIRASTRPCMLELTTEKVRSTRLLAHRRCDMQVGIEVLDRIGRDALARFGLGCVKRRGWSDAEQRETLFYPPQNRWYTTRLTRLPRESRDVRVLAVCHDPYIITNEARDTFLTAARSTLLEPSDVFRGSRTCDAALAKAHETELWKEPERPLASPAHLVLHAFVETLMCPEWHPRLTDQWFARILRKRCGLGSSDANGWLVRIDKVLLQ